MTEPTATDRAIAEGARVAGETAQTLQAEWAAIEREQAIAAGETPDEPDGELDKTKTTPRDESGRFKRGESGEEQPEKPAAKKGKEGSVSVVERAVFERQAKAAAKAAVAQREQQLAEREQRIALREQTAEAMVKARERFDAGDYDGAAQAFGFKTWNELNDGAARAFASPEYKRVKELERRDQEREAERQRERQQRDQAAYHQREQQILATYRDNLSKSLPQAEDPTVAALAAADPAFVDAVFHRVVAAARQGDDLDPQEVAEELIQNARAHFERVAKVFGGRPTSQAEAPRGASPDRAGSKKQPERPKTHVPRAAAAETSAPPEFDSDEDFVKFGAEALKRAMREDEAAGRSNQW